MAVGDWRVFAETVQTLEVKLARAICARACLRAYPIVPNYLDFDHDRMGLAVSRTILTAICGLGPHRPAVSSAITFSQKMLDRALEGPTRNMLTGKNGAAKAALQFCQVIISADAWGDAVHSTLANLHLAAGSTHHEIRLLQAVGADLTEPRLIESPLWRDKHLEVGLEPRWLHDERNISDSFSFWRKWYQGFLDGAPLDWVLQRRVALIPDDEWEKGPKQIAELIEEIEARYRVEATGQAVVDFVEAPPAVATIGHNNPPEAIEETPLSQADIELIARVARSVVQEIQKEAPNRETLEQAHQEIERVASPLRTWLAARGTVAADEMIKSLIKVGVPVAAGYVSYLLGVLSPFLDALKQWLLTH